MARARRRQPARSRGGTRRNHDGVRPHTQWGSVGEIDQLLLPDAQTSGGLLVAGEVPGATVIGDLTSAAEYSVIVD
jgi:selenide, water dikinase